MMQFSEVLDSMTGAAGEWRVTLTDDWLQGRSAFGGLQSALAVRAMRSLVPAGLPLRTVQTTFMAPVPAGEMTLRAQVLRTGKSATHVEARIVDGAQTLCIVIAIFGSTRESQVIVTPKQPVVESTAPIEFRFIPGLTPSFTRHYSMRWLRGTPPFTGSSLTEAVIEVGCKDVPQAKISDEHILAIADVIPPVALSLLKTPSFGSSMTWTLELLTENFQHLPLQGWRLDCELTAARSGYTSQSVMVWGPGGEPVALSRQNMVVFG